MIRLQDPFVIIVGKLFPMTLQTFLGVRVVPLSTISKRVVSDTESFVELLYSDIVSEKLK
jgi:hypothetical protein